MQRIGLLLALACAAWLLPAAAHAQEPWRPVVTACLSDLGGDGCTNGNPMRGAVNIAVSPDGRTAYVVGSGAETVSVHARDPLTGALGATTGCVDETGANGCVNGRGLEGPDGIVLSPDARFVYVGSTSGGVAVLERDVQTGALNQRSEQGACITNTGGSNGLGGQCIDGHGLGTLAIPLELSPDGRHLYLGSGPVAALRRDPVSGRLSQDPGEPGCVANSSADGCAPARGLGGNAVQSAIAPDGRHVYVPSGSGIGVFDRNADNGALTQKPGAEGCLRVTNLAGCTLEPRVADVTAVVVSPDGRTVYATGGRAGIVTLNRAADGSLTVRDCLTDTGGGGCRDGTNVAALGHLAISPDGEAVVAARLAVRGGLAIFRRDPASGALSQPAAPDGCVSNDGSGLDGGQVIAGACHPHPAVGQATHVTFAGEGMLYAGDVARSSMATVKRDFFPSCSDTSVSVAHNVAAAVPLPCADRNGDPLALAIARSPVSGGLGGIDAAGGRVLYSPFGGFAGSDSFTFTATGAGLTSAPATASLTVAAAPAVGTPPPPAAPRRIGSAVSSRWGVRGKRIFALALSVKAPPRGASATLVCKGADCPFRSREVSRIRNGRLTVFKALAPAKAAAVEARGFRAGQRLELRVTAAGQIGKAVRFKLRRGKIPDGRQGCLLPGANRFRTRC